MANSTGLCVVIVTHNEEIAKQANRIVTLNYGQIASDTGGDGSGA